MLEATVKMSQTGNAKQSLQTGSQKEVPRHIHIKRMLYQAMDELNRAENEIERRDAKALVYVSSLTGHDKQEQGITYIVNKNKGLKEIVAAQEALFKAKALSAIYQAMDELNRAENKIVLIEAEALSDVLSLTGPKEQKYQKVREIVERNKYLKEIVAAQEAVRDAQQFF